MSALNTTYIYYMDRPWHGLRMLQRSNLKNYMKYVNILKDIDSVVQRRTIVGNCRLCGSTNTIVAGENVGQPTMKSNFHFQRPLVALHHSANNKHFLQPRLTLRHSARNFSVQSCAESIAQTQAGWFKSLSESTVVSYAQDFFVSVHDTTGLPWWASIVLTTVILRTSVTVPLAVYQNYILAKVENLQLEMPDIVKQLKMETGFGVKKYGWSEKEARIIYNRSLKKQWKKLVVRDNCHPFKASILLWVQLPMWVVFSTALRNLVSMMPHNDIAAQLTWLELSVGGFAWIPNLTIPDASLIFPVTFGLVNFCIIELQTMTRVNKPTKLQRIITNVFRGLSLVMIPIAASVPACLCLYWTTSSVFGLGQNLILLSPKVKRITCIPNSASQLDEPYKHIAAKLVERINWLAKPFSVK